MLGISNLFSDGSISNDLTFKMLSNGTITSDSLSIRTEDALIQASDFISNNFVIETEDHSSLRPSLVFNITNTTEINKAKIKGRVMQFYSNQTFNISNFDI